MYYTYFVIGDLPHVFRIFPTLQETVADIKKRYIDLYKYELVYRLKDSIEKYEGIFFENRLLVYTIVSPTIYSQKTGFNPDVYICSCEMNK